MIIVTGSIVAKPDSFDELMALSLEHVRRSRAEEGCLSHGVHRDAENPLRLVFLERWTDLAAISAHFQVAASREFVRRAREMAAQEPELNLYDATRVQV